ncbi:glycoside hydrolase family 76 protein [Cylindrobasidium torrendii FP15055 ss-10]|uniref:Glycoside hydrolase family 76 protein n=1 Tax=Cylindrobasidium torrendii FP15055 ss-10 TaxID=1314674 RepID=A0A0D7B9Y6_9AGAR|nr:glycoside hydrolase family 76 protein [Cylindrobasidium torrendii FP15055 ss-10]
MHSFKATATSFFILAPTLVHGLCQKYVDAASTAAKNLQATYFKDGTYGDQAIWISAVDNWHLQRLDKLTGQTTYSDVINTVYRGNELYLEFGGSYDDVQWVVIDYLLAGDVDSAKKYYDIASSAVDSDYCGGGLFWSDDRDYKNSITNELYLATSGYMYEATQDEEYLTNLKDTWEWFDASALKGDNGLYNDGLTKDGKCANNGETQWTYNQGVVLVGLGYLAKYADNQDAVSKAYAIMDAIIDNLTVDGGLRESCESDTENQCNDDQQSFKGITIAYMQWFLSLASDDGTKYGDFIKSQADKIIANADDGKGNYSNLWYASDNGGADRTGPSQGAALGALVAAGSLTC